MHIDIAFIRYLYIYTYVSLHQLHPYSIRPYLHYHRYTILSHHTYQQDSTSYMTVYYTPTQLYIKCPTYISINILSYPITFTFIHICIEEIHTHIFIDICTYVHAYLQSIGSQSLFTSTSHTRQIHQSP